MSQVRVEVWSRRMIEKGDEHSRGSKGAFEKNAKRAHIHTAIWKATGLMWQWWVIAASPTYFEWLF